MSSIIPEHLGRSQLQTAQIVAEGGAELRGDETSDIEENRLAVARSARKLPSSSRAWASPAATELLQ
jgi:hypothetical protein